jgi:hypothetical protein
MDKTVFKMQRLTEADAVTAYWRTKSYTERIQAAYDLSLRAFGFDPAAPPRMDKKMYTRRNRGVRKRQI